MGNWTVGNAAKKLEICPTTARLMLSTWKEEGRLFETKDDKAKRHKKERQIREKEERKRQLAMLRQRMMRRNRNEENSISTPEVIVEENEVNAG